MISIKEAQDLIRNYLITQETESLPLSQCLGRITAETLYSPSDHPFFDQTAVDGYALKYSEDLFDQEIRIVGEMQAGATDIEIGPNEAIRIFTGASVPPSCEMVVMQEYCEREGDVLRISEHPVKPGMNIRRKGEQISKGAIALEKGTLINATGIGFIASLGIKEISVAKIPTVGILVTGGEFIQDDQPEEGKIYQSNGIMLQAALESMGIESRYEECKDDLDLLSEKIQRFSDQNDILIMTGGVSVGSYDYTPKAIVNNGFDIIFHKVNQKPGKPMLFASKPGKVVFGLPGNPRAVMIAFYIYILRYIHESMGSTEPSLRSTQLPLGSDIHVKGDRDVLLAANLVNGEVVLGKGQQSHMLQSLASADLIVHIPVGKFDLRKGEMVQVYVVNGT